MRFTLFLLAASFAAQAAELTGAVYDPSGARVPKASVILRTRPATQDITTQAGEDGSFRFATLAAGTYDLEVRVPGFVLYQRRGLNLADNRRTVVNSALRLGEVTETLHVSAAGQPRAAAPAAPRRIRVGGHVTPVRLLQQTRPIYPEAARAEGREGDVALRAVIGLDGAVLTVRPVSDGTADADFVAAAEAAVRQWRYEPGQLNGQPVEIITTVDVSFRLTGGGGA
ncbi:MAG: TonB family protein [Bryobacterales bacterium]|nr:TonB family protein [Bryobacterales bacterium]